MLNVLGDPVEVLLMDQQDITQRDIKILRDYYDLDKPLLHRYLSWLWKLLHFDLGYSYIRGSRVSDIILAWTWQTLKLQFTALLIAVPLAILLGAKAALKQFSKFEMTLSFFSVLGRAVPVFLAGVLAILFFSYYIPLFPSFGASSPRAPLYNIPLLDELWHLVLPATVLAFWHFALYFKLIRANMIEILRKEYILSAKASGLDEKTVVFKHALKNAIIPTVTYVGIWFGLSIGGSPVTESVFSWPGIGYLYVQSIYWLDLPIVMAINVIITMMILSTNLIVDLTYSILDPRIQIG